MVPPAVLVTGAGGFVGSELCRQLAARGVPVQALRRRAAAPDDLVADLYRPEQLSTLPLEGVGAVIHLAARVHQMRPDVREVELCDRINHRATRAMAERAAACGVRRFVFVSSVKVNGDRTEGSPFRADDPPRPTDSYGRSKLAAEQALAEIAERSGMELVVIRPPLVYGPGVKANFAALVRLVARGYPLPFAAIHNRRSLIGRDNLCDLLIHCVLAEKSLQGTFMAADGDPVSTPEMCRQIAAALGKQARLIPVPVPVLKLAGKLSGRQAMISRLCDDLEVDISTTQNLLGWRAPKTMAECLAGIV